MTAKRSLRSGAAAAAAPDEDTAGDPAPLVDAPPSSPGGDLATGSEAEVRFTLPEDLLRTLDAWIARQPRRVGREEAIRAFILSGLRFVGGAAAPLARLGSSDQHKKPDAFPMASHPSDPAAPLRKKR